MNQSQAADTPVADASTADIVAVAAALGTDPQHGLTAAEAASRLARDGPNELRAAPQRSAWRRALAQLQDPLVGLLLAAAGVALLAWWVEGRHGWPMDAIVISVVLLLNALICWLQENKAASAVASLAHMTAANSSTLLVSRVQQSPAVSWCAATCWCWPKAMPWALTPAC